MDYYYDENRKTREEQVEEKEQAILNTIKKLIERDSYPPSVGDITSACEAVKSKSTTHAYLKRLKEKGYIKWQSNTVRTIQILKSPAD
jgi:repressor LexA